MSRVLSGTLSPVWLHCRASLAGYETPKAVVFAASLPGTVGGKVLK